MAPLCHRADNGQVEVENMSKNAGNGVMGTVNVLRSVSALLDVVLDYDAIPCPIMKEIENDFKDEMERRGNLRAQRDEQKKAYAEVRAKLW